VTGIREKAIFRPVTVYNKKLSSQCNLPAQTQQVQDKNILNALHFFFQCYEYDLIWKYTKTIINRRYDDLLIITSEHLVHPLDAEIIKNKKESWWLLLHEVPTAFFYN